MARQNGKGGTGGGGVAIWGAVPAEN